MASPRVCGVNGLASLTAAQRAGPSPPVREKLPPEPQKSVASGGPSPRVRGERRRIQSSPRRSAGQPHVCGENARAAAAGHNEARAIPACAGRTKSPIWARPEWTVLRVCGENLPLHQWRDHALRAIPACAGRTWSPIRTPAVSCGPSPRVRGERRRRHRRAASLPGHPRACGENQDLIEQGGDLSGPSPRVRGERPGRTLRGGRGPLVSPGHPRVCGENVFQDGDTNVMVGPSPRVRGEHISG